MKVDQPHQIENVIRFQAGSKASREQTDDMRRDDVIRLLTTNLNEEKAADKKLTDAALAGDNAKAA